MFTVYILYSEKYCKTYVGYTSNIEQRFLSHNELGKKGWTVKFRPWKIIYQEVVDGKASAMAKEKYLKSGVGREWIKSYLAGI